MEMSPETIKALLDAFDGSDWREMIVTVGEDRLHVSRDPLPNGASLAPPPTVAPPPAPPASAAAAPATGTSGGGAVGGTAPEEALATGGGGGSPAATGPAAGSLPTIDSCVDLFPTAEFQEREVYDFFGIVFTGHPDMTRILMPEDWEGHPLRKDYPVEGYR